MKGGVLSASETRPLGGGTLVSRLAEARVLYRSERCVRRLAIVLMNIRINAYRIKEPGVCLLV